MFSWVNFYHLSVFRLYKLRGVTRVAERRQGIKLYNKCETDLFPELFGKKEMVSPDEVCLSFDGMKDEFTLLDTPIPESPHFEMTKRIESGRSITDCEYIRREKNGTLDGRYPIQVSEQAHINACKKSLESVKSDNYTLPVLYRLNEKLYVYDGKHRLASAAALNKKIYCYIIDTKLIANLSYISQIFEKIKERSEFSRNAYHLNALLRTVENRPRVLVVNRNKTDNLGDLAIGQTMTKLFYDCGASVDLAEFSNVRGKRNINTSAKPSASGKSRSPLSVIKNNRIVKGFAKRLIENSLYLPLKTKKYDAVIIGGGELVQSNGTFPKALDKWTSKTKKIQPNAKLALFAAGVTNKFSAEDKKLTQNALNRIDCFYVRDSQSVKNIADVFGKNSKLISDVVFYREPDKEKTDLQKNTILYGLTSFTRVKKYGLLADSRESYFNICQLEIEKLREKYSNAEPVLFYTATEDFRACVEFSDEINKKYGVRYSIADTSDLEKLGAAYQTAVCVVSPRMHGCILAVTEEVENVIPIRLSPKLISFENQYINNLDLEKYKSSLKQAAEEVIKA